MDTVGRLGRIARALGSIWIVTGSLGAAPAADRPHVDVIQPTARSVADAFIGLVNQALPIPALAGPRDRRADRRTPAIDQILTRFQPLVRNAAALTFPPDERLIVVAGGSSIIGITQGTKDRIGWGIAFDAPLNEASARIILIHNHPRGASLSAADLGLLSKPGVEAIVAIGHDGSLYVASAGPQYPTTGFEDELYSAARALVNQELRFERPSSHVPTNVIDLHSEHLVAEVLQQARVIEYRAAFSSMRQYAYAECGRLCRYVTESGGGRLRAKLRRESQRTR